MIYSALRSRLSIWAACGWSVRWVNLTSSLSSDRKKLMPHFICIREYMARRLEVPVEYAGVRTKEGNGVLHVLMAAKVKRGKAWSTACSPMWLSDAWGRLHGAPVTWIKEVKLDTVDRLRLSRYMVTQYMAHGQGDALERFFQSRQRAWAGVSVPGLRRALWQVVGKEMRLDDFASYDRGEEYRVRAVKRVKLFRAKWDELLSRRSVDIDGRQYAALPEGLVEI